MAGPVRTDYFFLPGFALAFAGFGGEVVFFPLKTRSQPEENLSLDPV